MANRENHDLAAEIRKDIVSELQAINDYQEHAGRTENKEAQELFRHIADEERHHAMELLKLLLKIDPGQCRAFLDEFGHTQSNETIHQN